MHIDFAHKKMGFVVFVWVFDNSKIKERRRRRKKKERKKKKKNNP